MVNSKLIRAATKAGGGGQEERGRVAQVCHGLTELLAQLAH